MRNHSTHAGAQELHADALVDEAIRLQNVGRYAEAEAYLNEAELLLGEAECELDSLGVPRLAEGER